MNRTARLDYRPGQAKPYIPAGPSGRANSAPESQDPAPKQHAYGIKTIHANAYDWPATLRAVMSTLGITRAELADGLHCGSARTIAAWERGDNAPALRVRADIITLCRASGIEPVRRTATPPQESPP